MTSSSFPLRWAPFVLVIVLGALFLLSVPQADAALDAVELWNEDFSGNAKVIRDGAVVGITATDLNATGGTNVAFVSDPTNPGDGINVTLYDDGTHGDAVANDGIYTGNFTVSSDGGSSGSSTSEAMGVIDIAEGDPISVFVDLDMDGSHSSVSVSTDYTGPGMSTPFTGGFVSGELIITITIIIEGEAPLDPASVTYSVDAGPSVLFTQIAPDTFQAVIDTFLLIDGPHVVTTLSADEAGNIGTSNFDMIVDNTVPDITYVCTTIASNGNVLIDTQVTDLHLNGDTIKWNWDDGDWVFPMLAGNEVLFTVTIPYDDIVPGQHGVTVTAKDLANNTMTLITRWILPEQDLSFLFIEPPVIDPSMFVGCETVPIQLELLNEGEVPLDLDIDLVVDDLIVDTDSLRLDAGSRETIMFVWPDVIPGSHDLDIVVNLVNDTTTGQSTFIVEVKDPTQNALVMLPDLLHVTAMPITSDDLRPGDTVEVESVVMNFGEFPQEALVQLVVNGEVVDTVTTTVPALTNLTVDLMWHGAEEGTHDMEVRVFMPVFHGTEVPVDTYDVRDTSEGSIRIEGTGDDEDGDKTPVDQFLDIFEPVNQYLPMEKVPEEIRPWLVPLLLVVIFGFGIVILTRKKPKKDEIEVPDTDLKPVEMPAITGTGAPSSTPTDKPDPSTEDGSSVMSTDDDEAVTLVVPDALKTPSPGGPVPIPYPTTGMTTETPSTGSTTGTTTTKGPEKPPATAPPIVPPIASTTDDDGKGEPCVEIIKSQTRAREEVSDAQAATNEAKKKERDAQDEAETAGRTASDAEQKANTAQKECDDARKEYEGHDVEEAEKEAKNAEDRLKDMEERLEELEGDIPTGDGVSLEPKPGYHSVGVGRGTMILPTNIYYRDAQAERDHMKKVDERWKEFKKTKKDLDKAKDDAKVERNEADEAAEKAKDAKRRMDEACKKAKAAQEEANTLRGAANDAETKATKMGADAQAATEKVATEKAGAKEDMAQVNDCKDCLAAVRRTLARIENLKRDYRSLKGGSALSGPQRRHNKLDGNGAWDEYWKSFKRLRDNAKALSEIKGFTEADLPSEFSGLWDWGGGKDEPVDYLIGATGTYVGMRAEDYVKAPIPTDTIKAVGGLYIYFQARLDPEMSDGRTTLWEHLEPKEAHEAELAFKRFSRVMTNGIKGFEKLYELAELDGEIGEALKKWQDCLDNLPETPETPEVDFDKLCYKQCLDKLKELEEAERKLRELVNRAQNCEPDGLDDKLQKANKLKGQLERMGDSMDKTSKGLEDYRKAMTASSGCYISTAAYGSSLAPELDTLRGFRDQVLLPTQSGQMLVDHYYRSAPGIADRLETREGERASVQGTVGLAVRLIHAREDRGPVSGALLSLATVGVYGLGSLQAWLLTRR